MPATMRAPIFSNDHGALSNLSFGSQYILLLLCSLFRTRSVSAKGVISYRIL